MAETSQSCYDFRVSFTRWDPLRDLFALQERIDRMADAGAAGWTPPVDLYETADRYVLTAELPGLDREDIDINVVDGTLTLRAAVSPGRRRANDITGSNAGTARSGAGSPSRRRLTARP